MTGTRMSVAALVGGTTVVLVVAGCASGGTEVVRTRAGVRSTTAGAAPAGPSAGRPCPPPESWQDGSVPPTRIGGTPANTPEAEELSQAVGTQGRGAFADVYGSQIVDFPVGRVALCVTDLSRGRELAAAAKRAAPTVDLTRLDLYLSRFSQRRLDAAAELLDPYLVPGVLGFPLYSLGPAPDASGLLVESNAAGAASAELRARLQRLAGGVPVSVHRGQAATPA